MPTPAERTELASRLHSAAIHLLRRVRRQDPESGLSPARLSALSVLVFGGPRTVGALAAAEQVTAPTMTRLVAALEEDGYLTRRPSPDDGRAVIVAATPRAVAVLHDRRRARIANVLALFDALPEEGWDQLARAIELLERALASPEQDDRDD